MRYFVKLSLVLVAVVTYFFYYHWTYPGKIQAVAATVGETPPQKTNSGSNPNIQFWNHTPLPQPSKNRTKAGTSTVTSSTASGLCNWSPNPNSNDNSFQESECFQMLSQNIVSAIQSTNKNAKSLTPSRWLFLGDSTVGRLFDLSPLSRVFGSWAAKDINQACSNSENYRCRNRRHHSRCDLNHWFGLESLALTDRVYPNLSKGEGPWRYGLEHPGCQDCGNCHSDYVLCKARRGATEPPTSCLVEHINATSRRRRMYGGYFSIDFARDVELQTLRYHTTQEVIAQFIHDQYNADNTNALLVDFGGPPICVVSGGLHDMAMPNMTLTKFLHHTQWYLRLLQSVCSPHMIWLSNAAPLRRDDQDWNSTLEPYRQTKQRTTQWNQGVQDMIQQASTTTTTTTTSTSNSTHEIDGGISISIVDVFDASIGWEHDDNVHLSYDWYNALGTFFVQLAEYIASGDM